MSDTNFFTLEMQIKCAYEANVNSFAFLQEKCKCTTKPVLLLERGNSFCIVQSPVHLENLLFRANFKYDKEYALTVISPYTFDKLSMHNENLYANTFKRVVARLNIDAQKECFELILNDMYIIANLLAERMKDIDEFKSEEELKRVIYNNQIMRVKNVGNNGNCLTCKQKSYTLRYDFLPLQKSERYSFESSLSCRDCQTQKNLIVNKNNEEEDSNSHTDSEICDDN